MKNKRCTGTKRFLAVVMAVLIAISILPMSWLQASAATGTQQTGVTVVVTDEKGQALEDAKVNYTIASKSGENSKTEEIGTNADGVAVVLPESDYIEGDLTLTASVTKTGYDSDTKTIVSQPITGKNQEFKVSLRCRLIQDVTVTPTNKAYEYDYTQDKAREYDAAEISGIITDGAQPDEVSYKLYSLDANNQWVEVTTDPVNEMPKISAVGKYHLYVTVNRADYDTFTTDVFSEITSGKIKDTEYTITPLYQDYVGAKEGEALPAYPAVNISGGQKGDKVTVTVSYGDRDETVEYTIDQDGNAVDKAGKAVTMPEITYAGLYPVTVTVHRNNYEVYQVTDIATLMSKAKLYSDEKNEKESATYDGMEHDLVAAIEGIDPKYKNAVVEYSQTKEEGSWSKDVPRGMNAGTYPVYVRIDREGDGVYEETIDTQVTIKPAKLTVEDNDKIVSSVNYSEAVKHTKEYNFSVGDDAVKDVLGKPFSKDHYTVTYELVDQNNNSVDSSVASIEAGKLVINEGSGHGGFVIKVKTTVQLTDDQEKENYNTFVRIIPVSVVQDENLLSFEENGIAVTKKDYTFGTNSGLISDLPVTKLEDDLGDIQYAASVEGTETENSLENVGIEINQSTGELSISNYKKLAEKLSKCEEKKEDFIITITATKSEGKVIVDGKELTVSNSASAEYKVGIKFAELQEELKPGYSLKASAESDVNLKANAQGWFNQDVYVVPKGDYKIAKDWNVDNGRLNTQDCVVFDDEGSVEDGRIIYLQDKNGGITAPIHTEVCNIDMTAPDVDKITITYDPENVIKKIKAALKRVFHFYDKNGVTVTITAEDNLSGVASFNWEYQRADDASKSNLKEASGEIKTENISVAQTEDGKYKYEAKLTLPQSIKDENKELNGKLSVSAVDVAGKESAKKTDDGNVIVVDSITPEVDAEYSFKGTSDGYQYVESEDGTHHYTKNNVTVTFKVKEANFNSDNVNVAIDISKDGDKLSKDKFDCSALKWTPVLNGDVDCYQAEYTLTDLGDYTITVKATDYSNNSEKKTYKSDVITIDKTAPEIKFETSKPTTVDNEDTDDQKYQSVEVIIDEHNFRASDVSVSGTAKDVTEKSIDTQEAQIKKLNDYIKNSENWTDKGDLHTIVLPGDNLEIDDAIYDLEFSYEDLAKNSLDKETEHTTQFVLDREAPQDVTLTYSDNYTTPKKVLDSVIDAVTGKKYFYSKSVVTLEFSATDQISGVHHFTWSYYKEDDTSSVNKETGDDGYTEQTVVAEHEDKSKLFTGSVTIPLNQAEKLEKDKDQLRGYFSYYATDKCEKVSTAITDDDNIIVVDTKNPEVQYAYTKPSTTSDTEWYYNKEIEKVIVTFTVKEANFYAEDFKVKLSENAKASEAEKVYTDISQFTDKDKGKGITFNWTDGAEEDVHIGICEIPVKEDHKNDADYQLKVQYSDRSGNQMKVNGTEVSEYVSPIMTVDTKNPEIKFETSKPTMHDNNEDTDNQKYQSVEVTINEHNFQASDVSVSGTAKNVKEKSIDTQEAQIKKLNDYIKNSEHWKDKGDLHTIVLSRDTLENVIDDALYNLEFEYEDLAKNSLAGTEEEHCTELLLDHKEPGNVKIEYSKDNYGALKKAADAVLEAVTGKKYFYYQSEVILTFSAEDEVSGVDHFVWTYNQEKNVSENANKINALDSYSKQSVKAVQSVKTDGTKTTTFTATVTLPPEVVDPDEQDQLRGYFEVSAIDKCGNGEKENTENNYLNDENNVVVVDNISPEMKVSYKFKGTSEEYQDVVSEDGKEHHHYTSKNIEMTLDVTEANFYQDGVVVELSRDAGATYEKISNAVTWTDGANDLHTGTYTIKASENNDVDYRIRVTYADRSGNEMKVVDTKENCSEKSAGEYISSVMTIDTIAPEISFDSNPETDFTTDGKKKCVKVTITEHNFRASDIKISENSTAEDISQNDIHLQNGIDQFGELQAYLQNPDNWSVGEKEDEHVIELSLKELEAVIGDAIYNLKFVYQDLAKNSLAGEEKEHCTKLVLDRVAPGNVTVEYSDKYNKVKEIIDTVLEKVTGKKYFYYNNLGVTLTFSATDQISGVDHFTWSYNKEDIASDGASDLNVNDYMNQRVDAVQDSNDKTKFSATVKLPKAAADQLRGSFTYSATDRCGNPSEEKTDISNVIVVDSKAPVMVPTYTTPSRDDNSHWYYNKNIDMSFAVTEANFYKEDVVVELSRDAGATYEDISNAVTWTDGAKDLHTGTYTIPALNDHSNDADYRIHIKYEDRSGNKMNGGNGEYVSNVMTIDTKNPVITVSYANQDVKNVLPDADGHNRSYFNATQTATVTINEHNFVGNEVNYTIIAKDVTGKVLNADALCQKSVWTDRGDIHTMTITYSGDANYTFDVAYTDLATNEAADYSEDYFTVDKTVPMNLTVQYSPSILDTALNGTTYGFYNAKVRVTITAEDETSGVHDFQYAYKKAIGVSAVNAELINQIIDEAGITYSNDGRTATSTFEIPRSALGNDTQFNGNVLFTAKDRGENESNELADTKRIVVDNIVPTANVEYNTPVHQENGISYYDGAVTATVTMNEANFYPEDVVVSVTKDGAAYGVSPSWSDQGTDVHIGTFTLSEDGDYFITMNYRDKSSNQMVEYSSEQLTVDTEITAPVITVNGEEANGRAFKDEVVPAVSFSDINFDSYKVTLTRTRYDVKDEDVTEKYIGGAVALDGQGGNGSFDTFEKEAETDGIYTMTVSMTDKAGHSAETTATFTVNRFGSVYVYNDQLIELIKDGGAYVQPSAIKDDLVITEYNADKLLADSLDIEVLRDGKPMDDTDYSVTPEINDQAPIGTSGWYQYQYTITKKNFAKDGVYKIAVASKDATGNSPETTNYEDKGILFHVDGTVPEITSIAGLEESIINAQSVDATYSVYDTMGLKSIKVLVDGKTVNEITDFADDRNNYEGDFVVSESKDKQTVELVVTDLAGNVTDTNSKEFKESCAYAFNDVVTISTNPMVRAMAWVRDHVKVITGTVAVVAAIVAGIIALVLVRKRKESNDDSESDGDNTEE